MFNTTQSNQPLKKILFLMLFVVLGLFASNDAKASHAAGAELLYSLVPNTTNTYNITFKFYRYCTGAGAPNTVQVCYWNNCNTQTYNAVMNKISGPLVVGSGCPNFPNKCTNPQSAVPGYEEHIYQTTVTLPSQCDSWHFSSAINARNPMTWMGTGTLFVETTFDNTVSQNDDSPYFSVQPVPYCCTNTPFTYNMGTVDINGDSLYFESINPLNAQCGNQTPPPVSTASFAAYNVLTNPIDCNNTFVLNSQTGAISFTPGNNTGTGVITIKCSAYRNSQLISTVMRDIQVVVLNCSPPIISPPLVDSTTLFNVGVDSLNQVVACSGDSIGFCFNLGSADSNAVLVPSSNIGFSMPGATLTYTGVLTDSIQACISWPTTQSDTGLHVLVITLIDSSCVPPGIIIPFSFSIPIFIDYGVQAWGDTTICSGDSTQLHVSGGGVKTWSVLPGGSPISSLSCINCDNPWVKPTVPTTYIVEGCDLDTVIVDIAAIPTLVITPNTTTCINADLQLNVTPTPAGQQYDYLWTPSTFLTNDTIASPVVQKPTTSTVYNVTVTPYGAKGPLASCAATESVTVYVLEGFNLNPYDSILCDGESSTITGNGSTVNGDVYTYSWSPTAAVTPTNTINTTITPPVPGATYIITASFPGCPDSVIVVPMIVDPVPVVNAGLDREMCLNDTIHMQASVVPDTIPYTIAWTPPADFDNSSIDNPVYSGKTSSNLTVKYTTTHGCEGEDEVRVVVNNVDFLNLDGDRSFCPGDSATLMVSGGLSYYWYPDYYISSIGNVTQVTVAPKASQEYFVVGIDNNGCYDTASANVTVYPGAVVDAGVDVTIYPGETIRLSADGNASLFSWFPPSGLSSTTVKDPVAAPTATTRYYVNASTEFGCTAMDSTTVIVNSQSLIDLPNVFSPGSGTSVNDMLRIKTRGVVKLKRWDIFNRWGNKVFTTTNIEEGWNGRMNGKPLPIGAYVYVIEATTDTGERFYKQGNVTLVR